MVVVAAAAVMEVVMVVEVMVAVVMAVVMAVVVTAAAKGVAGSERRHAPQHSSTKARCEDRACHQRSRHL